CRPAPGPAPPASRPRRWRDGGKSRPARVPPGPGPPTAALRRCGPPFPVPWPDRTALWRIAWRRSAPCSWSASRPFKMLADERFLLVRIHFFFDDFRGDHDRQFAHLRAQVGQRLALLAFDFPDGVFFQPGRFRLGLVDDFVGLLAAGLARLLDQLVSLPARRLQRFGLLGEEPLRFIDRKST